MTLFDRFWKKIDVADTGCWEWTACKVWNGYGRINIGGKARLAHRVSYELHRGPAGEMDVCHQCDNPACVNPQHLFLGTRADNMADMVSKGRGVIPRVRGSAHGRSKLTEAEAISILTAKNITQRELARKYGVSQRQVSDIRLGKKWAHLTA